LAAVLLACVAVYGCQTAADTDDEAVPPEKAKQRPIIYRATGETANAPDQMSGRASEASRASVSARGPRLDPIGEAPPRDIADIRALLAQASDKPTKPEAAAKVAKQPPTTDDRHELASFHWERARAAGELAMDQLEVEDLRRAAEYAKGLDTFTVEEDRILSELAAAESRIGNLVTAAQLRERAIEIGKKRPGGGGGQRLANYQFLVQIYSRLGERDKARAALADAESWLGNMRNSRNYSWFQYNWPTWVTESKAILLEDEGKYAEAEVLRHQVVADRKRDVEVNKERTARGLSNIVQLGTQRVLANAQRALAMNLVKQQKLAGAEGILRRRIYNTLNTRGRYFIGTGVDFATLSTILYEQGRNAEARETVEIALEIFAKLGLWPEALNIANSRRARAAALTAEGRYREALVELEQMKQGLAQSPYLLERLGKGDVDWALALVRTGRAPEAVTMLEPLTAELRGRLGPQHYETAEAHGFLALAFASAGRRDEALKLFAQTVPVLVAAGESTDGRVRTPVRTRRYVQMLEAYLELLADQRGSELVRAAGIDPVAEAFRVADLARAQGVQRALTSGSARAAATDTVLAELVTREQEISQRLTALHDLLAGVSGTSAGERSEQAVGRLRKEVADLEKERKSLYAEIERRYPSYANLLNPKPATVEGVRAALGDDEALVAIYVGDQRSYIWAVSKNGAPAFSTAPLGAEAVDQTVARLRKALDPGAATLGAMPPFDVAEGYKLYRELLKPVETAWRGKRNLLVVPHRALGRLPFALLPTEAAALKADQRLLFESYRKTPWLVREAAVTQYPSANAFITLRALPPGNSNRRTFAGFGDPLFNSEQLAEAQRESEKPIQLASAAGTVTRGARLPLRNLTVARVTAPADDEAGVSPAVANSSRLAQVPRLPDTGAEIREIASALGANASEDVFLQLRANEDQVRRADLANRKVVMFATHGLVPGELDGLGQPALALTAPQLANVGGDGLLTMEEVLQLKLNADWVVLSACNTAAGDGKGGEAFSGLGRAFFYAGSRAMLVTQWPVETTSARALTTELFRRQAKDANLTRAEALRQAMLALIDGPGYLDPATRKSVHAYAHPLFWAPYTLVGDGGK
jgi:CHAT domain-containing protein